MELRGEMFIMKPEKIRTQTLLCILFKNDVKVQTYGTHVSVYCINILSMHVEDGL